MGGLWILDIHLGNFLASPLPSIFNFKGRRHCFSRLDHLQAAVLEGGVAQSMPKGEQHFQASGIVPAITHVQAFPVLHRCRSPGKRLRGCIFQCQRKSFSQLAAGVHFPRQDISQRAAAGLPTQVTFQHRWDLFNPRHFYRRAVAQDHNHLLVFCSNSLDQGIVPSRKV